MNLIAVSIRRPVFAWILMSAFIIFGAVSLLKLGVSQLPDVDFPVINIAVTYDGASPEVIEAELLDPIEQSLLSIEGIKQVKSIGNEGSGTVTIDFDLNRNVDVALQEVQSAVSRVRLPPNVDFPVIRKVNPEEEAVMIIALTSDKSIFESIKYADLILLDKLRTIPGIGEVGMFGLSTRNIRIWPDLNKLKQADLSLLDIATALNAQHLETSAGRYQSAKEEFRLRWQGEATTVEEVSKLQVIRRGGQTINDREYKIGDLARVEDGLSDVRRMVLINGREAVDISIRKQRGGNEVELAKLVKAKMEEINPTLPAGYKMQLIVDFTRPTAAVVHTTYEKLILAAFVTILICGLFLGSWQAAVNVLFSIPTSIVGTFTVVYLAGFTLNLFSLLALTLAISIVVDDAIMLLENIIRHYRMGKTGAQAAYDGAMEILPAATAATAAVVAVFLPVVFMSGVTGKFFFQFGVTLCAAVLLSLVEAVTITPMRAAALLRKDNHVSKFEKRLDEIFEKISHGYRNCLNRVLAWPKTVVLVSFAIFAASASLSGVIKQEFVPAQDQDMIFILAQAPLGSNLNTTATTSKALEEVVRNNPNTMAYLISVGVLNSRGVNDFSLPVFLIPREKREKNHMQIMEDLRKEFSKIPNLRVVMSDFSARNMTTGRLNPLSFNLSGPDLRILETKAAEIMKELGDKKITQGLNTDFKTGLPEVKIKPDRKKMLEYGVSAEDIANTLSIAMAGIRQNRFTADGRRIDMRIKLPEAGITKKEDIGIVPVRNMYGNLVPINNFVQFEERPSYSNIIRVNRQRAIGVFGGLMPEVSQGKAIEEVRAIAARVLPEGYSVSFEGASAGMGEAFSSLTVALAMGILVAYMILAIQFNSFLHPLTVLVALPFSLTGAFAALWIFGVSLNLFSFIGIIVLMGIAKKNSILLVEFANQVRERGESVRESLGEAGATRLRPILMTSFATVFAALPLVVGNSIGQETRTPMGLVIIGGTIISTIFTLLVVPCIYLLLSRFERSHVKVEIVT